MEKLNSLQVTAAKAISAKSAKKKKDSKSKTKPKVETVEAPKEAEGLAEPQLGDAPAVAQLAAQEVAPAVTEKTIPEIPESETKAIDGVPQEEGTAAPAGDPNSLENKIKNIPGLELDDWGVGEQDALKKLTKPAQAEVNREKLKLRLSLIQKYIDKYKGDASYSEKELNEFILKELDKARTAYNGKWSEMERLFVLEDGMDKYFGTEIATKLKQAGKPRQEAIDIIEGIMSSPEFKNHKLYNDYIKFDAQGFMDYILNETELGPELAKIIGTTSEQIEKFREKVEENTKKRFRQDVLEQAPITRLEDEPVSKEEVEEASKTNQYVVVAELPDKMQKESIMKKHAESNAAMALEKAIIDAMEKVATLMLKRSQSGKTGPVKVELDVPSTEGIIAPEEFYVEKTDPKTQQPVQLTKEEKEASFSLERLQDIIARQNADLYNMLMEGKKVDSVIFNMTENHKEAFNSQVFLRVKNKVVSGKRFASPSAYGRIGSTIQSLYSEQAEMIAEANVHRRAQAYAIVKVEGILQGGRGQEGFTPPVAPKVEDKHLDVGLGHMPAPVRKPKAYLVVEASGSVKDVVAEVEKLSKEIAKITQNVRKLNMKIKTQIVPFGVAFEKVIDSAMTEAKKDRKRDWLSKMREKVSEGVGNVKEFFNGTNALPLAANMNDEQVKNKEDK